MKEYLQRYLQTHGYPEEAQAALYSHPELLIYPGICIFIAASGFNLFGEALRDILQPQGDVL